MHKPWTPNIALPQLGRIAALSKNMSIQSAHPAHLARVEARLTALKETLTVAIPRGIQEITWEVGSGHGHFL
ncbi:MAG TPA: hypothetical protein VMM36_17235, partial [Opitutaceae bacterium]|nr:hypothetical protein [Opitutaceae bacterium]